MTQGKVLEYLGMTLNYTTMYEYKQKLLTEFPSDMNGSAKTYCWTLIQCKQ